MPETTTVIQNGNFQASYTTTGGLRLTYKTKLIGSNIQLGATSYFAKTDKYSKLLSTTLVSKTGQSFKIKLDFDTHTSILNYVFKRDDSIDIFLEVTPKTDLERIGVGFSGASLFAGIDPYCGFCQGNLDLPYPQYYCRYGAACVVNEGAGVSFAFHPIDYLSDRYGIFHDKNSGGLGLWNYEKISMGIVKTMQFKWVFGTDSDTVLKFYRDIYRRKYGVPTYNNSIKPIVAFNRIDHFSEESPLGWHDAAWSPHLPDGPKLYADICLPYYKGIGAQAVIHWGGFRRPKRGNWGYDQDSPAIDEDCLTGFRYLVQRFAGEGIKFGMMIRPSYISVPVSDKAIRFVPTDDSPVFIEEEYNRIKYLETEGVSIFYGDDVGAGQNLYKPLVTGPQQVKMLTEVAKRLNPSTIILAEQFSDKLNPLIASYCEIDWLTGDLKELRKLYSEAMIAYRVARYTDMPGPEFTRDINLCKQYNFTPIISEWMTRNNFEEVKATLIAAIITS